MYTIDEAGWLIDHHPHIDETVAHHPPPADPIKATSWAKKHFSDHSRVVLEYLSARDKAGDKLVAGMLTDLTAAQQATDRHVAAHRAAQLTTACPDAVLADVTCSIGGDLYAYRQQGLAVIGGDLDPVRARLARHNVDAPIYVGDALAPPLDLKTVTHVIADPARRTSSGRITHPDDLLPPLSTLWETYRTHDVQVGVKCAPGIDYSTFTGHVQVTSLNGGVKEVFLATDGFGFTGRQAVVITTRNPLDRNDADVHITTVTEAPEPITDDEIVAEPGRFIIDPDGAIVRAGLVRDWAQQHGLHLLDPRIAHVTGESIPAGFSGFEVIEQVPIKAVAKALRARDCGSVEILIRGVDAQPDQLRKQWKLKGSQPLAVVITRIGSTGTAFICQPRHHQPRA